MSVATLAMLAIMSKWQADKNFIFRKWVVLNDMVKRVYVHAPKTIDGKRTQEIDIVYDLVGILPQSLFKHEETA